uniref:Protein white n=1 Tax=Magallana gigas TaxID=29159 RepID=K1QF16_MAGGI
MIELLCCRVFLLAEGRVAFSGPVSDALEFFKSNGYPCPNNYNPADHFVITLAIEPGQETHCRERVKNICDNFEASEANKEIMEKTKEMSSHPEEHLQQFFALILGLVYLKTNDDYEQKDIMNINGVIFIIITNLSFYHVFSVLNIPFLIIIPIIYMSILYWMSGLIQDGAAFINATGVSILISNAASSFGYVISTAAPSTTAALAIAPALMIPFLLFGGFFLNSGSTPDYLIWLKYISWFYYGNEMLVVNQWEDVNNIRCSSGPSCVPNGELTVAINSHGLLLSSWPEEYFSRGP